MALSSAGLFSGLRSILATSISLRTSSLSYDTCPPPHFVSTSRHAKQGVAGTRSRKTDISVECQVRSSVPVHLW
ncbi:hypothetical protein DPMN_040482 [Dreissena polymorpha]|uniref:Secreted protein n=1 Tax=Dreissena polymorpha TaxID=45954 RepID=A0A9D4CYC2_DREPO|nr:hypothetical protein DPMN_040482 [Dreissena polymorpha]